MVQQWLMRRAIQARLRIGEPGDRYEQEADRVADAVVRMPGPASQSTPEGGTGAEGRIQRLCPECEEEARRQSAAATVQPEIEKEEGEELARSPVQTQVSEPDEEEEIQSRTLQCQGGAPSVPSGFAAGLKNAHSESRPLPRSDRSFFEPRFGRRFGRVCVHAGPRAASLARSIRAEAFTRGSNIYFGAGRYDSASNRGRHLLAHELTHVVQQRGVTLGPGATQPRDAVRESVIRRVPVVTLPAVGPAVHAGATWASGRAEKHRREKIEEDWLSLSKHCGWIDWGHANPKAASGFIARVRSASKLLASAPKQSGLLARAIQTAGSIDFALPAIESYAPGLKWAGPVTSVKLTIRLLQPLKWESEVFGVALGAYMLASVIFEKYQGMMDGIKKFIGMPSSEFATEDLPSNLIGFYRAARGYGKEDVGRICGVVSKKAAKAALKTDKFKPNPTFIPSKLPKGGSWPAEFSSIEPILPLPGICSPYHFWEGVTATVQAGGGPPFYLIKPVLRVNPLHGGAIKLYKRPPMGDFDVLEPAGPGTRYA